MGKAYAALMEFKDVVKANPITPSAAAPVSSPAIDAAAGKLASAAYPFLKEVDWTSDLSLKPLPGASPKDVLKAIDKALVMGAAMDGAALKEAANAHVKAIGSIDAKGLTSQADFAAINAGLGKAFAKVVPGTVPNFLYSTVNPNDAQAAYRGFLEFKDVVRLHAEFKFTLQRLRFRFLVQYPLLSGGTTSRTLFFNGPHGRPKKRWLDGIQAG